MTDNKQQSKLEGYINDIIKACEGDPTRLQVAISNFQALCDAMKGYERAPRYYNAIFEEGDNQANLLTIKTKRIDTDAKLPIISELEKIYGWKLKHIELQQLAKEISDKLKIKVSRDTKRSKILLLEWFSSNWETIRPKMLEYKLDKMTFESKKK